MFKQLVIEVPEEAVQIFGGDEAAFSRKMYETAVATWFDEGLLSQGQAAEILGLSRGDFFEVLREHKISPVQISPEELAEECGRG